ncbi:MAG: cyclic nucleotide-binding domain-containing protein [Magnetococcales bacterium]|nr:cyclic nucleotide-binding domain-containing protein [Magnetococcales bacterium]
MLFHANKSALGKKYSHGEVIIHQGDPADFMYVVLDGEVEIILDDQQEDSLRLAVLGEEEVFGELALFDDSTRIATAKAIGDVRVLSVDKKNFLQWVGEEPTFTLKILMKMANRTKTLIEEVVSLRKMVRDLQRKVDNTKS